MKKCPFCAEEIQDDAIKCKHCGEWLKKKVTHSQQNIDSEAASKALDNKNSNERIVTPRLREPSANISEEDSNVTLKCPHCSLKNKLEATKCEHCGERLKAKNSLFSTQPTDLKFGGYTLIFLGGINIIIGFFGIIGATIFQFIVGLVLLGLGFGALKHSSFLYIGTIIWSLGFVIFCINYFTDSQTQRYPAALIIQSWFLWQLIRSTPAYGKFYNRKKCATEGRTTDTEPKNVLNNNKLS